MLELSGCAESGEKPSTAFSNYSTVIVTKLLKHQNSVGVVKVYQLVLVETIIEKILIELEVWLGKMNTHKLIILQPTKHTLIHLVNTG